MWRGQVGRDRLAHVVGHVLGRTQGETEEEKETQRNPANSVLGSGIVAATGAPVLKIGVVGGGPAGLLAAMLLVQRGHSVEVFEGRPKWDVNDQTEMRERSYPVDITGHGMVHIRKSGPEALAEIATFANPHRGMMGCAPYDGEGASTVTSHFDEPHGGPGLMFSRNALAAALQSAAEKRGDITVHFNVKCLGADVEKGQIQYQKRGEASTSLSPEYDLLIGADGVNSQVRESMENAGLKVEKFKQNVWVRVLNLDKSTLDLRYLHSMAMEPAYTVACSYKQGGGQCCFGTRAELQIANEDQAREFIKSVNPKLLDMVTEEEIGAFVKRANNYHGNGFFCENLHLGKTVLIGDAGHAFPPCGQGVNAALESSGVLDDVLTATLTPGTKVSEGVQAALAEFSRKRIPEVHGIASLAKLGYPARGAKPTRPTDPIQAAKYDSINASAPIQTDARGGLDDYHISWASIWSRADANMKLFLDGGSSKNKPLV